MADIDWDRWLDYLEGTVRPRADYYLEEAVIKAHCYVEEYPPALVIEPVEDDPTGIRQVAIRLSQTFALRWWHKDGVHTFKPYYDRPIRR